MKNVESTTKIDFLSNLSEGETGEIIQVRGKPEIHRYLCSQGLMMGRSISVNNALTADHDQFFTVRTGDRVAVIDKEIAGNIKVLVA
jgi:Fe2+ transport system protein FeoA